MWENWTKRGELSADRDNIAIAKKILQLRRKQSEMHDCKTYSEYALLDTMAKNTDNVSELLHKVWIPACESANYERSLLAKEALIDGIDTIEPWDWRYYAEKVRGSLFDFDENEMKPYFSLDRMVEAIFDCAKQLFDIVFIERTDIPMYHPDVKVYEVREHDSNGKLVALFLHDNYAR